jgi:hypothetical protein
MEHDHEIIKDIIAENNPEIKREDITIDGVWEWDSTKRMGSYLMVETHTNDENLKTTYSFEMEQYNQRLTEKLRSQRLDDLGI